jgi:hypothetical protein
MLDHLLTLVDQIGQRFQTFLGSYIDDESVRGAIFEVDRYWANAAKSALCKNLPPGCATDSRQLRLYHGAKIDVLFRPSDWPFHCKVMGYPQYAEPFLIRVVVRKPEAIRIDLPNSFENYPILYEYRNECHALLDFGTMLRPLLEAIGRSPRQNAVSVGRSVPNTAGTLGGILKCAHTARSYVLGCAHVLGSPGTDVRSPGPYEGKPTRHIGRVVKAQIPPIQQLWQKCNVDAEPRAGRLDFAIAELDDTESTWGNSLGLQPIHHSRRVQQMDSFDPVFFVGKVSGRVDAELGGVTMWDTIRFVDGLRCFGRIFEMRFPGHQYLNADLGRPGDSGAWVLSEIDTFFSWDGMLFASDGNRAYGCFAEAILNECQQDVLPHGTSLSVGFGAS